jgi:hypothetical protein
MSIEGIITAGRHFPGIIDGDQATRITNAF